MVVGSDSVEQVSNICAFLCGLCAVVAPIALVVWIVMLIKKSARKNKAKRFFLGALAGVALFTAIGVATSPSTRCEHEWEIVDQIAPTCTENGTTVKRCTICDTKRDGENIPPTGHTLVETRTEPTCESDGMTGYKCKECDYGGTELIPATGHKFVEKTVQEVSCASVGVVEKICSVCNKIERSTTEKIAHTYKVTSTKAATLDAQGIEESTCSVCGDIKQKELVKLGTKENPGKVTIEQLVYEINSDIDAAKAKYNNQWIEITGKVLDTGNVAGMTKFYLHGKFGDSGLRIICWVNEEVLKPFYYEGEVHTFLGQMREITTFNATEIGDCEMISD